MEQAQLKELVGQVVNRAREDAAFREAVQSDPRATVEQTFGVTLPADLDVVGVRDRVASRFQAQPALDSDELSDAELDAVAGGADKSCMDDWQCGCGHP